MSIAMLIRSRRAIGGGAAGLLAVKRVMPRYPIPDAAFGQIPAMPRQPRHDIQLEPVVLALCVGVAAGDVGEDPQRKLSRAADAVSPL